MKNYRIVRRRDGLYYIQRRFTGWHGGRLKDEILSFTFCFESPGEARKHIQGFMDLNIDQENPIEEIIDI